MNLAITTLNSKYIHPSVALRIIRNDLNNSNIKHSLLEYTIKEDTDLIVSELLQYDIVAFSCYIYNIEKIKDIINLLKNSNSKIIIILGGPEVSFLNKDEAFNLNVDYIVCGEAEKVFKELIQALVVNEEYDHDSLIDVKHHKMNRSLNYVSLEYTASLVNDFSDLDINNQIVYLETSRGCPYQCSYCQASLDNNVRNFGLEDIFKLIDEVLINKVKLVKFLDRTFNFDVKRTNKILNYIIENDNKLTTFQFEITGELLDYSSIKIINDNAPAGLFRFEIGIQSTNIQANHAIRRYQDFEKLKNVILMLQTKNKVILHLDLIAGLPYENLESFKQTFNEVFALKPAELQLGFLKLLKGTALNDEVEKFNYIFDERAPYEIICNDFLTKTDLQIIDNVEHGLNNFYNQKKAKSICLFLMDKYEITPFDLFEKLGQAITKKMQIFDLYQIIISSGYLKDDEDKEVLLKNYYQFTKQRIRSLFRVVNKKAIIHELIAQEDLVQNEVFKNACVEQINLDKYFVYLLNKQQYYLLKIER